MDELLTRIKKLEALLEAALTRIGELEAEKKQNSGNSSKSPSSDLGRKRKPPVEPSGRKRGGQPGHAGQNRALAPPEEVDEVVDQDPPALALSRIPPGLLAKNRPPAICGGLGP